VTDPNFHKGAIAQLGERLNGIQEVGGSIPPGSTNLRRFAASVGKPTFSRLAAEIRGKSGEGCAP
jgi:hypothetical protein